MKDRVTWEATDPVITGTPGGAHRPPPGSRVVVPTRLYKGYIFDLDGTIYLGHDLLPGAKRLIEQPRARGTAVRFLS